MNIHIYQSHDLVRFYCTRQHLDCHVCHIQSILELKLADAGTAEGGHVGAGAELFAYVFYQGADVGAAADVGGKVYVWILVFG